MSKAEFHRDLTVALPSQFLDDEQTGSQLAKPRVSTSVRFSFAFLPGQ